MRAKRFLTIVIVGTALPFAAFAQSDSSQSASSLIAEITQLEQQISALSNTQTPATTPTPASSPASGSATVAMCPALTRTLSLGSSGADVADLQSFLAQEGFFTIAPTGYYGSITQAAVASWQEREGIVSGGDASTTGLGVVGPRTLAAIESSCGGQTSGQQNQCLAVEPPSEDCATGWNPVTDANGCTIYYQCVISLPTSTTTSSGTPSTPAVCPVVQQPTCSGQVVPFQTNSNGCVTSYECVL